MKSDKYIIDITEQFGGEDNRVELRWALKALRIQVKFEVSSKIGYTMKKIKQLYK